MTYKYQFSPIVVAPTMNHAVKHVDTRHASDRQVEDVVTDVVAVEEPMEIRLRHWVENKPCERSVSITMRTPGADYDLAMGFLFTEGIIKSSTQVSMVDHCGPLNTEGMRNVVKVTLAKDVTVDVGKLMRNFYTTSSCGVCGKSSLQALQLESQYSIPVAGPQFEAQFLVQAPDRLRAQQSAFDLTGGIHAAGLMDQHGHMQYIFEDVGRHNAVDKVIGAALAEQLLPLSDYAMVLSGRASFELLQKSLMAGIPLVAAVGAPSSLAVNCATHNNMTLVGFLRDQSFNVYTAPERLIYDSVQDAVRAGDAP